MLSENIVAAEQNPAPEVENDEVHLPPISPTNDSSATIELNVETVPMAASLKPKQMNNCPSKTNMHKGNKAPVANNVKR